MDKKKAAITTLNFTFSGAKKSVAFTVTKAQEGRIRKLLKKLESNHSVYYTVKEFFEDGTIQNGKQHYKRELERKNKAYNEMKQAMRELNKNNLHVELDSDGRIKVSDADATQ
ncbi:hypothetical protein [Alkalihalobacillus sp. TS-13]|uniref:hypothetical protein n=1 Tax=Alkalihalobacillus sp. TS-13 TaxID=2842455 RepID=UPI001C882EBF|nr:hypothetical protein [Alkalihalobacillus sp. TS-13]